SHGPGTSSSPDPSDHFKLVSAGLALLCLILLLTIGFLSYFYLKKEKPYQASESVSSVCSEPWRRFKCSCFFVSLEPKTWSQSKDDCEKRGANLTVIENRAKQEFFKDLRMENDLWIGLYYHKKKWTWVNGILFAYKGWKSGVNENDAKEGSAAFVTKEGLLDHTHNGHKGSVCQRDV
ncbi:natural killer cells antigen CD94-like, partial [Eucyclogobius newberryi]|uniref:natural killer cells antigen CD94-like n=1 Tax=Eucyclogobius newberryi TaxID=166745 RepID=UPI003B5CB103